MRKSKVCIFLHIDGLFLHKNGHVHAYEGIPRVVDVLVQTIMSFTSHNIIITGTASSAPALYDFFRDFIAKKRLEILTIDAKPAGPQRLDIQKLWAVEDLNNRADIHSVFVPHYYLFPECLLLTHPVILYLPDYFPYLMPDTVFDVSRQKDIENKAVGAAIVSKAEAVLTNSHFTKGYLPDADMIKVEEIEKVIVAPLPILGAHRDLDFHQFEMDAIEGMISGRPYLFYPTANRPNKQIAFLLRLFALLKAKYPELVLVLTCDLNSVPSVADAARRYDVHQDIILAQQVSDGVLRWLYRNAAALCLTSTAEGNFPPQVLEALSYATPIVSTLLPTIIEALNDLEDLLLLCRPLDLEDFLGKIEFALTHRDVVLGRQKRALAHLEGRSSRESFFNALRPIFDVSAKHCAVAV